MRVVIRVRDAGWLGASVCPVAAVRVVVRVRDVPRLRAWLCCLAAAPICALAFSVWTLRTNTMQPVARKAPHPDALAMVQVEEQALVLGEATIQGDGEHRKVAGVLVNKSGRGYANVSLAFALTRGRNTVGIVWADISRIAGHASVRFATEEFAHPQVEPILREIKMPDSTPLP